MRLMEIVDSNRAAVESRSGGRWMARTLACLAAAAVALTGPAVAASAGGHGQHAANEKLRFTGDRAETERFLAYYDAITLTPEQEAIRKEALEALPAPCCSKFSAATCCCKCNMARATWGLAKYLIVERNADAVAVRTAVADWHKTINPGGFTGDACFNGGCGRPFAENGCGGMKERELVF